jgi:hypothetical protein
MKSKNNFHLFTVFTITFIAGVALISQDIAFCGYYLIFFILSFYMLSTFKYGEQYFVENSRINSSKNESDFLVVGQKIAPDNDKDLKEDNFFKTLESSKKIGRVIFNLILYFSQFIFLKYFSQNNFSPIQSIPLIITFMIVNSTYVGHLLIPLFLISFVVIFKHTNTIPVFYYYFFTFFVLASLAFVFDIHELMKKLIKFKFFRLKSLVFISCFYFSVIVCFSMILIEPKFPRMNQPKSSFVQKKSLNDLIQNKNQDLEKHLEKIKELLKKNNPSQETFDLYHEVSKNLDTTKALKETLNSNNLTEEQRKIALDQLSQLSSNSAQIEKKINDIIEGKATNSKSPENLILKREQQQKIQNDLRVISNAALAENLKKKDDEKKDKLVTKLKKYLPIFVLIFLFLTLLFFWRKKGIQRILSSNQEMLSKLKAEWHLLSKEKLSPRDEVIKKYNFLHDSLRKIHYRTHESPPSCIIHEDLSSLHPNLERDSKMVTEVFAQCLYGGRNVTPKALDFYRKSFLRILKIFNLN